MSVGCISVFSEHILTHLAHVLKCTKNPPYTHKHSRPSLTVDGSCSSFLVSMFLPLSLIPVLLRRLPFSHLIFWNSSWLLSTLLPAKLCPLPPYTPIPSPTPLYHVCYPLFLFVHYLPSLLLLQQSFSTGFIRGSGTKDWEGTISGCYCLLLSSSCEHLHCSYLSI